MRSPLPGKSPAREIDTIFSGFHKAKPGRAVGVAQAGKTVLTRGYGMADLERAAPISSETVFESGAVSGPSTFRGRALPFRQCGALLIGVADGGAAAQRATSGRLPHGSGTGAICRVLSQR